MEGLSQIEEKVRVPVDIAVHPHLMDHCVEGQAVLPAVEAMQILSASVKALKPDMDVACLAYVRFDKFLYIQPDTKHLTAFNDISVHENGNITAELLTKTKSPKTPITRIKEHARICFIKNTAEKPPLPLDLASALEGISFDIPAHRIYRDLVPFGPAYHNIQDVLHISEDGAVANIRAPVTRDSRDNSALLGSPFPLDAAFHSACVWGQRFARFVAFPVGFEKRMIFNRTRPGETYISRVIPVKTGSDLLVFDVWIYDSQGVLFEAVSGVQMKDISAGRMKPPQWIIFDGKPKERKLILKDPDCLSIIELKTLMPFAEKSLAGDELKRFEKMGKKRKQSYLAARLACKRLSRKLSGNDINTPADHITTICSDQSRPSCPLTDGSKPFSCAASHDDRFAVAVASGKRVGIDVEKISEKVLKSQDLYMSKDEQALVQDSCLGETESALRVWSIKEAVSKALNTNLADSWKRVRVKDIGSHESCIGIDNKGDYTVFHDTVDRHLFTIIEMA